MKKIYFITILIIISGFNLYARGLIEETIGYPYPRQYIINMTKEEMILKLQSIVNINEYENHIDIPIRLYRLIRKGKNDVATIMDDHSGDLRRYGDVTFYFKIQYVDNSIFLTGYNIYIAEDLNYFPNEIEVEKIFFHVIVEYLLGDMVYFNHFDNWRSELMKTTDFMFITIYKSVPVYEDFRTEKREMYGGWEDTAEIINLILQYEWIINGIEFPNDYIFYRHPDYRMEITAGMIDRDDFILINLWTNNDQYFVQISTTEQYYSIDINKLNEILHLKNIKL